MAKKSAKPNTSREGVGQQDDFRLSQSVRRRVEKLSDHVERATAAGQRFFERHPNQSNRVRKMSGPEREQLDLIGGAVKFKNTSSWAAGPEWAVAVRQIRPDVRLRQFRTVPPGFDYDQPEIVCAQIFDALTRRNPTALTIEHRVNGMARDLRFGRRGGGR